MLFSLQSIIVSTIASPAIWLLLRQLADRPSIANCLLPVKSYSIT